MALGSRALLFTVQAWDIHIILGQLRSRALMQSVEPGVEIQIAEK